MTIINEFKTACEKFLFSKLSVMYSPNLLKNPLFSREDTRRLAQALHTFLRTCPEGIYTQTRTILPFLERFLSDIRKGKCPPHPAAFVHILGIFKEARLFEPGRDFWLWLSEQDDTYVDQAVYGAAIELLAYRGRDSLRTLEELYQDALKRFPGTFAEYHLSPEAVVPDRTQPTNIPGIPIALLQGILTARLLNRDWKNAYLALDTALRLYPTTVPTRFFEVFMAERPLSEVYTVFLLACRAGVVFKPNHLTTLLARKLRVASPKYNTLYERALVFRGEANAIYAYLEAGGTLRDEHIGSFLNSFQDLLPPPLPGTPYSPKEESIRNSMLMTAHRIATSLVQAGMKPSPQIFTALINLAARYKIRPLLDVVLTDVKISGIDMGEVGRRVIIHAAGAFKDKELLEKNWAQVSAKAESDGSLIDHKAWIALALACRRGGCPEFFHKELEGLRHAIDKTSEERAIDALQREDPSPARPHYDLGNEEDFSRELGEVERIMKNVAAVIMAGSPLDFKKSPFDMFLDVYKEPIATEEDLRAVYNDLTTDPHQPAAPQGEVGGGGGKPNVTVSITGIPLDELRFQNWVTIVELMAEAEATERLFQKRVDEAMKTGRALDAVMQPLALTPRGGKQEQTGHEMEATEQKAGRQRITSTQPSSRVRLFKTVKRLRGPYTGQRPHEQVYTKSVYEPVRTSEGGTIMGRMTREQENTIPAEAKEKLGKGVPARVPFQPTPSLRYLLTMDFRG